MRTVAEVFQQDAELMHDTMAETLAKAMLTYEFIAINSLLCDILGTIACLSKAFQLKSLSFANVQPAVTSTINVLRALQIGDEGGPKFQEFLANIAENNGETRTIWQYIQLASQPQTTCNHSSPGPPHPASLPARSPETSQPDS
ncbi:hypothetical protein NQZ68_015964 [Dissostichus eleginoides]|nr:hypothetical protein NQZ68_015964 [Dissostichus eleginoides]